MSAASPADRALVALRRTSQHPLPDEPGPSSGLSAEEWVLVRRVGYEACGLVAGGAVFHLGLVGTERGTAEVTALSATMVQARELAVGRLMDDMERVGGTGVLGLHLDVQAPQRHRHTARFVAVGTAVRRRRDAPRTPPDAPFVCSLSGQHFASLVMAGLHPLSMVMGTCVMHVARQAPGAWAGTQLRNVELPHYTGALAQARERAMGRLQAEASQVGADGVIGVQLVQQSHVWGSHVIELLAIGNAVRDPSNPPGDPPRLAPRLVLPLRDPPGGVPTVAGAPGAPATAIDAH